MYDNIICHNEDIVIQDIKSLEKKIAFVYTRWVVKLQVFYLLSYIFLMKKLTKVIMSLGLFSALIVIAWCTSSSQDDNTNNLALAECLTAKGVTMYGTNRCPHCQNQKSAFGYEAFTKVNFVDCDKQKNICGLEGITGYPTWKFPNGTELQGEQDLETLAAQAWCLAAFSGSGQVVESTGNTEVVSGTTTVMTGSEISTTGTSTGN